jgi:hypothetical protein
VTFLLIGRRQALSTRAIWSFLAAVVVGLVLTGLVDARWYTGDGAAFGLAAGVLGLVAVLFFLAPGGRREVPKLIELVAIGLAGLVLTALFWVRARAGLRGIMLADLELTILALFGWAWPALLLVALYRTRHEGWRPGNRRRFGWLCGTALLAGAIGWLLHWPLWQLHDQHTTRSAVHQPDTWSGILLKPTESPLMMGLLGGPLTLRANPPGVVARHPVDPDDDWVWAEFAGRLLPGISRNLSWHSQGTNLVSSDPRVVGVELDENGRWVLQPRLPGPAIVTVSNRRARTYIGVWVTDRDGRYAPFTIVNDLLELTPVRHQLNESDALYTQTLRLRNRSDQPVLGPIHAVFRTDAHGRVALSGARRTARIQPAGLPSVVALDGSGGNRAPVLKPGERVEFEILVTPPLTSDWLLYNVDLVQAFTPP